MIIEEVRAALAVLEQAMKIEEEGRQFYLQAAQTTEDKAGREMFVTLANDEGKHYNLIKSQQRALISAGRWIGSAEIQPVSINLDKPLFPQGIKALEKAATAKSGERDALLFGLDVEIRSYDLYRRGAAEISDPLGRQMFEFLAGQEMSHFNLLMMRFDALFGPISWQY